MVGLIGLERLTSDHVARFRAPRKGLRHGYGISV